MIDQSMATILQNFSDAGSSASTKPNPVTGETTTNSAAREKNAMKSLLEGLNAVQETSYRAVAEEFKNTYGVGDMVTTPSGPGEIVKDLGNGGRFSDHFFAVRVNGEVIRVGSFELSGHRDNDIEEDTIAARKPSSDVYSKGSLSDIFKTMAEADEEDESRLAREFHSKMTQKKVLPKGPGGKSTIAEKEINEAMMSTSNIESMVADMKRLMSQGKTIQLIAKESHVSDRYKGDIYSYSLTEAPGE
jgi:hypothetical protein